MNGSKGLVCVLGVAGLVFASCQGVRSAPKGTPRVEIEVGYDVDGAFYEPFQDGIDQVAIQRALRSAVDPLTDVGLRFYPVATERYGPDQRRPDYVMSIRATRLVPDRNLTMKEEKSEEGTESATITARLRSIAASVAISVEKRRTGGPMLKVGEATGTGTASPSREEAVGESFPLDKHSNEDNETAVDDAMLQRALRAAAEKALVQLQDAIDRDLRMLPAAEVDTESSTGTR